MVKMHYSFTFSFTNAPYISSASDVQGRGIQLTNLIRVMDVVPVPSQCSWENNDYSAAEWHH